MTDTTTHRAGRLVEVFADVGCPFTHLGLRRFVEERRRRGAHDTRLHIRAWPLEVVNGAPLDAELVAEEIDEMIDLDPAAFAGFRPEVFPPSTLPAMALAGLAHERGGIEVGEQVSLELRRMLFVEGRPLDAAALADVAGRHGLAGPDGSPPTLPAPGDPPVAAVLADHAEGVARGVIGSPHFFIGDEQFFCPALDVGRDDDGHLRVRPDPAGVERLMAAAFG